MSTKRILNDRREALEESFFKKENEALLSNFREKKERHECAEALASAMAFDDEALAEQLGITYQQVQKYEMGMNRVSVVRIWQLCNMESENT